MGGTLSKKITSIYRTIPMLWESRTTKSIALIGLLSCSFSLVSAQSWVDSMTSYAHEQFMPANKYKWTWQSASLLRTMVVNYELRPAEEKQLYLDYVRRAMDNKARRAHGSRPNAVASANGMAFLWRITSEEKYRTIAEKIYADYLKIPRTESGGIAHLARTPELWDDTIYMISVFLLEMYRATGDEKYLDEIMDQFRIHRSKLLDEEWGLWVHGWDGNDRNRCALCGQRDWPDPETRRSTEFWGRGNGWVVVTISDILRTLPEDHSYHIEMRGYLKEMIARLPELQDPETGHWFQLPAKPDQPGNWIESSATAMFGYGMLTALKFDLVEDEAKYRACVDKIYRGLSKHSTVQIAPNYLTTKNVCKGTCIGDMDYYLNRKSVQGKSFGLAMFMLFGLVYEEEIASFSQ